MSPKTLPASIVISSLLTVASRRSRTTSPNTLAQRLLAGTSHAPARRTSPNTSRVSVAAATTSRCADDGAGRSSVMRSSSDRCLAAAAASTRSASSSSVRRPSAAASRSVAMVVSRSASDARTPSGGAPAASWRLATSNPGSSDGIGSRGSSSSRALRQNRRKPSSEREQPSGRLRALPSDARRGDPTWFRRTTTMPMIEL